MTTSHRLEVSNKVSTIEVSKDVEEPRQRTMTASTCATADYDSNIITEQWNNQGVDESRDDEASLQILKERPERMRRLVAKVLGKRFNPRLKNGKPAVIFNDSIRGVLSLCPSDITDARYDFGLKSMETEDAGNSAMASTSLSKPNYQSVKTRRNTDSTSPSITRINSNHSEAVPLTPATASSSQRCSKHLTPPDPPGVHGRKLKLNHKSNLSNDTSERGAAASSTTSSLNEPLEKAIAEIFGGADIVEQKIESQKKAQICDW